jgi:acetyl esterase
MTKTVSPPAEIVELNRVIGAVIDPNATMRFYADLLSRQPTDGAAVQHNVAYGNEDRHRVDVYRPATTEATPVVIFFHGGGYSRGDKSDRSNIGHCLAREGILTLIASYRLAPEHKWPSGAEDVIAALRWAQTHVRRFGGAPDRIFLMGESAGAAHVALAGLSSRFHGGAPLGAAGLILHSGSYDVALEWRAAAAFGIPSPDYRNAAYFGPDQARYPEMSTVDLIDTPDIRTLITFAEFDPLQFQVQASELFATLARRAQSCPTLLRVTGHGHISQICSFNTADTSLSDPLIRFVKAR